MCVCFGVMVSMRLSGGASPGACVKLAAGKLEAAAVLGGSRAPLLLLLFEKSPGGAKE